MPCLSIQKLLAAVLAVFMMAVPALARAANGIDTASGVNNLPINVEGVMGMTLYNMSNSSAGPVYVGIGTTVPYAPFTIHTGANQNLAVEPASGWGVSGIALQSFNDAANLAEPLLLQGSTLYLQATGGDISIGTSASPSATISVTGNMNVTGNVGIGTTSPMLSLHVANGGAIFANSSANNSGVYMTSGTGGYGLIQAVNAANTAPSNLALQGYGGNVGIGMTDPSAPLDVNGGIRGSNSSSVVAGGNCSPEGMIGYDLTNHEPVYCSSSEKWQTFTSTTSACGVVGGIDSIGCYPNGPNGGSGYWTLVCGADGQWRTALYTCNIEGWWGVNQAPPNP